MMPKHGTKSLQNLPHTCPGGARGAAEHTEKTNYNSVISPGTARQGKCESLWQNFLIRY